MQAGVPTMSVPDEKKLVRYNRFLLLVAGLGGLLYGIGVLVRYHVDAVARTGTAEGVFHVKDAAWRNIFWISMPPGLLFVLGSFFVTESPRWLFRRGQMAKAEAALLRSRNQAQAALEL